MSKPKILYIGNDLATKTKYNSAMQTLYELLTNEGYDVIKSSSKKNSIFRLIDMLLTTVKNRKVGYVLIDTFSTSAFYYAFFTSQLARFFKLRYIPILHGGNLPKRLKKSPKMTKAIFNNSFINIAPSNYLKTAFKKEGFRVIYIPNTLAIENYQYKERNVIEPKLLWVRAFRTLYNPAMAIKILSILKQKYANAKLCMVGPFKDNSINEVKQLIKEYNLEKDVEITGVLPKEKWINKSKEYDIFINTTTIDNTPVSVMEAMALGLIVVSTNVGGLPYLISDKVDGFLAPNKSEEKMTDIIIELLQGRYSKTTINARKKAESFAWKEVRKEWLKVLK